MIRRGLLLILLAVSVVLLTKGVHQQHDRELQDNFNKYEGTRIEEVFETLHKNIQTNHDT